MASVRGTAPSSYGIGPPVYANPAPAEPGDLLLVHTINDTTNQTLPAPAGWTLIDGPNVSSTHTSYLFGRIADGTSLDRFAGTWSGAGNWLAEMVAVADCARSSVAAALAAHAAGSSASGTVHPTPAIALTQPYQLVLAFYSADASNASHDWQVNQTGFVRLYEASEEIGHQSFAAFSGAGPVFPTLFSVTENISSAEVGNEHVVAIATGPGSYDYAIALETQVHGLELEDGNGDLRLEDNSGTLLEEEPIGGLRLEDDSGAILNENSDYIRLELDQSLATDRLLLENGLGVLVVESASPWFQHYSLEDASGNLQLEDASGSLTSEELLFYAIDLETGDRLLLENGEVLISEEPESLVVVAATFAPARVRAIMQAVGRSGST